MTIERYIRGLNPWPSAYTYLSGKQLKIWKAAVTDCGKTDCGKIVRVDKDSFTVSCGQKALEITEVQIEGKKRMEVSAFLLGNRLTEGDRLGK